MDETVLQDLVRTLEVMAEAEKTVGEFYESCSVFFQHDADFWSKLADEEAIHADVLTRLSKMVMRKPHEYEPGKLPSVAALRTFISRLHSDRERLKNGTLTMHDALLAAYLTEMTVIECNYTEVVQTANSKCLEALENLATATVQHRGRIKDKMQDFRKIEPAGRVQGR